MKTLEENTGEACQEVSGQRFFYNTQKIQETK